MAIVKRAKQLKLIENLYAQPGEFFYEADGAPFEGEYHMYDKKNAYYFEGPKWNKRPVPIVPFQKVEYSDPMSVEYTNANAARGRKDLTNKTVKGPKSSFPIITSTEIEEGEITRFLVCQANTGQVFEIDETQYKKYSLAGNPYNSNYKPGQVSWFITGPLFTRYSTTGIPLQEGIYERNYQQRDLVLSENPLLAPLLSNLLLYTMPEPEDDLHSDGSFLFLPTGQKYIGKYHIHPSKGPMVGRVHTSNQHDKLIINL